MSSGNHFLCIGRTLDHENVQHGSQHQRQNHHFTRIGIPQTIKATVSATAATRWFISPDKSRKRRANGFSGTIEEPTSLVIARIWQVAAWRDEHNWSIFSSRRPSSRSNQLESQIVRQSMTTNP